MLAPIARSSLLRSAARSAAATRAAPLPSSFAVARRGYAEAVSDKLQLSFILPHSAIYSNQEVTQVNACTASGDMGILSAHVPSVESLKPGLLEVIESSGSKKFFVSGGFLVMHPNNKLTVNAIEAFPLEDFSPDAVRSALSEAQRVASGSGSPEQKAEAEIEVEVYTALQAALGRA
ncbi:putative ATP synthase delta chain precursor, mitochondrial [Tilletiaria anomala UBC 951]|uniref:ATP synthase subunit delta, mitochondrial n=1 Tax=Tilletiaria anomala (strain ATCC 24038 / CBS 436.72 / UBC 951) TaxID=1037660 RepID=A0A066VI75_TILAU|nr:putative ATP synthase delta chain precursor, mitochondrial [Tilletiaria anomala UBC 951]KDN41412.1 putative ATP synthase delta chain precursor, mitochondrial [Tilletiaria anomala UBC 951]